MKRPIRLVLLLVALTVIFWTVNVFADDSQQNINDVHNGTGMTVNDLEMYLDGNVLVSESNVDQHSPFTKFSYVTYTTPDGKVITKLRWYGAEVAHCQIVKTCIKTDIKEIKHVYEPKWSIDGTPYKISGPVLSHKFDTTSTSAINLTLSNTALDGGPVTVGIVQVGPSRTAYTLPELVWNNLNNVPWTYTRNNVSLSMGGGITFNGIALPAGYVSVVYRAKLWLNTNPTNIIECVGEYTP